MTARFGNARLCLAVVALCCAGQAIWAADAPLQLKLDGAVLVRDGQNAAPQVHKDTFGPGLDGADLSGSPKFRTELRFSCKDVPEGDYYLGQRMIAPWGYFSMDEGLSGMLGLYLNDTRVLWNSHTEPRRPQKAADGSYQAEMRVDKPLHIKPGDIVRVVALADGGGTIVGAIRLYKGKPAGSVAELWLPDFGKPRTLWLNAELAEPVQTPTKITQGCTLHNPGVLPRTFHLKVEARDYLMAPLMPIKDETLTLDPGQTITKTYEFAPGLTGRDRFTFVAEAPDVYPDVRLAKYYAQDRTEGPRPSTSLNGKDWQMCYVDGVEPGDAPPAGAAWTDTVVPSVQPNAEIKKEGNKEIRGKDHHCAWYRKQFTAPAVKGERVILKCNQVLTEGWFYLNGKRMGHEIHGSTPFEVDVTAGYKPGEKNELLVAVRDWLAYSPKNVERAKKGEPMVVCHDMNDLTAFGAEELIGIGASVWLEARPAVSVDDVFVVTSVREKKFKLKYRLINTTGQAQDVLVTPRVMDEGQEVKLALEPKKVTLGANATAEVWFESAWDNAKYWWPDDPHLYALRTDVQPAQGASDRHWQRFGFREMWIEGYSFMLNGVRSKTNGCATGGIGAWNADSNWEPAKRAQAYWDAQTDAIRTRGIYLARTHLMREKEEAADIADETGVMSQMEGDVGFFFYEMSNKAIWEASLQADLRRLNAHKNHPSITLWSGGNENMWGCIYRGETFKNYVNDWQIKIAKAMREFDLMRRPICWEADGDLFGRWEQHSLHYPRDVIMYCDVPNGAWWGPWDGKTVAQDYQFGPIILGKKPINIGEYFWPCPLQPYLATILLGDKAYMGGNYLIRGWIESSQFFLNGSRDAESANINTYLTPKASAPRQTIILKEETTEFYGGRTLTRGINIHNDMTYAAKLTVRWSLLGKDGSPAVNGESKTFDLQPAELKRHSVDVKLPAVTEPLDATWRVELLDGEKVLRTEERPWRICPPATFQTPAGLDLAVYDPAGATADALKKLGIKFQPLDDLSKLSGKALMIGKKADLPVKGTWRETLASFVRAGGKVILFERAQTPDFLPVTVRYASGRPTTVAFVRAGDHPIMKGLTDADMRWWSDDHYVGNGNWHKPTQGRWLPLADVGTGDGMTQSPMVEVYDGKGSYVLCQMLVIEKAATSPPAGLLLQNMLDYLAASACFRSPGQTAILAGADSPLRKSLTDSRLVSVDLTGKIAELKPERYDVAIVDVATALDESAVPALQAFASGGGQVLLHRGTPQKQALLEKLLGVHLRFFPVDQEPNDIRNRVMRLENSGPLAGVSNHELCWISPAYLNSLRREGSWTSDYDGGCPAAEQIADYFCCPGDDDADKVQRLTMPCSLMRVPAGKGAFVLNQMKLDQPIPETAALVERLRNLLLTNLGCDLKGDADAAQSRLQRLAQYKFTPVDLGPYANRGIKDDKAAGIVGWANQEENDMSELPTGKQTFAGVPFVISTPKSVVTLHSVNANRDMPKEVKGIKVGVSADLLYFLHATAWSYEGNDVCVYRIHYEDGTAEDIPIRCGQQVFDWWTDPAQVANTMAKFGVFAAWQGKNPMTRAQGRWGVWLPCYEWANPHPEKVIRDIDFLAVPKHDYGPVPVLAGITAASLQGDEGIVTDIINTRGIKVKLGGQEKEVYYIGVAGIDEKHPFYAKAIEAHKAMVIGKKVKLVYDAVRQNNAGQTMAYVYLGDPRDMGNLLNGRIVDNGLGSLGNFEGNDRLRMYLMNTGEPAKWRKVGMWAAP
jgi:hypothetical protein